jgi:periplasmic protein TonB
MGQLVALAKSARLVSDTVEPSLSPPVVAGRRRMAFAIGTSALVHVAILVAAILLVRPLPVTTSIVILPVALVSHPGAGGGGGGGGQASPPAPEAPPPAPEATKPAAAEAAPIAPPRPKVAAKPRPTPATTTPIPANAAPAPTSGVAAIESGTGTGAAGGPGSGGGGPGSSGAGPAYGVNPQPPYPMVARRMGFEGTVVLRVVVAADGSPESVAVLQSSGHDVLDTAALDTVRSRWRFVPARRNGIAVEDSVQVPIRFRQTDG